MTQFACPSCGAPVKFQSRISVFAICEHCRSMLVRQDLKLEAIGQMALLPEDLSPFQLGTQGRFRGIGFQMIGRLKLAWSDGNWNEWHLFCDDGRSGWLAEADGFLMINFPLEGASGFPPQKDLKPGLTVNLSGKPFSIDDIKEVTCVGSEGELPFRAPTGRKSVSVDLVCGESGFACLDYSDEGIAAYLGESVEFDNLHFSFLREIDGWGESR